MLFLRSFRCRIREIVPGPNLSRGWPICPSVTPHSHGSPGKSKDTRFLRGYILFAAALGPGYMALFGTLGVWNAFAVAVGYTACELLAFVALKANRPRLAAYLLIIGIWAAPGTVILFSGGLGSPLIVWLTPALFLAGALLSGRAATLVGTLSLIHILGLIVADTPLTAWNAFPAGSFEHFLLSCVAGSTAVGTLTFFGVLSTRFQQRARAAQAGLRAADDARVRAETVAALRSQLLANTSHEIRTPLNGILGSSRLLLDEVSEGPPGEYVQAIHDSALHLRTIIDDLLDLSRAESGRMKFESIPFDGDKLVADVIQLFMPTAHGKRIGLTAEWKGEGGWFLGDPSRVRQILANLVGNAVKFTEQGSVRVIASVDEHHDPTTVRFDVIDSGPGIAFERQEEIFLEFVQADSSTTREYGGTGLGLAISRRIARLMGGDLVVVSAPGEGATFHVSLPIPRTAKPATKVAASETAITELRVLVVDDNPVNRMVASRLLKKTGASVATANDGQEACEAVFAEPYDLVLMDLQMPVKGGLAATEEIRASEHAAANVPIWAFTASAFDEEKQRCYDVGMQGVLTKPVVADDLVQLVKSISADKAANEPAPVERTA